MRPSIFNLHFIIFEEKPSQPQYDRNCRSIKTKLEESSGRSRRGRPPWADNVYAATEDDEIDRYALSELGMLARR